MALTKDETSEEGQAFLDEPRASQDVGSLSDRRQSKRSVVWYLRIFVELLMALAIVLLLVYRPKPGNHTLTRSPVPNFPRKMYTFKPNPRYLNDEMWYNKSDTLHTLHHWIELSSDSRGYVVIKNANNYDLPKPHIIAIDRYNDGPGYMMTVFHQLHCLSYIAEHFQEGYDGVNLTEKVAHHTAHCFNYIRQGLMCSADTTLEGESKEGPGEGSEHECVDYDALRAWANKNSAMKWREALLPSDSIL